MVMNFPNGIPALYIATTEELKLMWYHDPRDRCSRTEIMEDAARMLFQVLPEIVKIKGVLKNRRNNKLNVWMSLL
ncbi:MAG: hypothetical protein ACLU4N_21730 [Butyricimonas faecihominis]